MSFTLATLKTAIQNYTENDETTFTSTLDTFIKNTEERILKNTHLDIFRKNATGTMTASNQFLAMPTDFLSPFSLSITSSSVKTFLDFKDVNFIQTFNPNSSTTGTPRYYASFDVNTFIIGPTPDSNYSSELHYYYRPASLTAGSDSGTTWLSENATQAMLYGSLVEAYTFMKGEPDVIQSYNEQCQIAMGLLKMEGDGYDRTDAYRTGQRKIKVS